MDIATKIESGEYTIKCIDMHTCGEPTRIIYRGFPETSGTLLDQRSHIEQSHDDLRRMLMHEPRGHQDMYGALLRPHTELTETGEADIGVLFMHNDGLSTMCGHASLALARFLVDTHDVSVFERRNKLKFDAAKREVHINLHAPCGLIKITTPTNEDGTKSDLSRLPSFLSVPSFAAATSVLTSVSGMCTDLNLPSEISLDIAYGGAFYAIIDRTQLLPAITAGIKREGPAFEIKLATLLKQFLCQQPEIIAKLNHSDERINFLYGVALADYDQTRNYKPDGVQGCESATLIFADGELDRSPTGSCVVARMALAHAKGQRHIGERWAYNSLVSNHFKSNAFVAEIVETCGDSVVVKVEGQAFYTGVSQYTLEPEDPIKSFRISELNK